MAGTAQHGEEPCGHRSQQGDPFGVGAKELLGLLHHHLQSARLLEGRRTADDCDDGEHNAHRWFARLQTEDEDHEHKADARDQTEPKAPVPRTEQKSAKNNGDLKDNCEPRGGVEH